jgi:FkbM family methyltransferase
MGTSLKTLVKDTLRKFDIGILRYANLQRLMEENSTARNNIELILELPEQHSSRLLRVLNNSKSQVGQDLFVLSELDFKTGGFFVEFGATNGVDLSNSYLLEKDFGWSGILAEPAKRWHRNLRANRSCNIETDCVWRDSHSTLTFNETDLGEYSTIDSYSTSDDHREKRKRGKTYGVKTISLEDMLDKHHAPKEIDYLSIDTEGSEYEILSNFNFEKYRIRIITCEHNFTPNRENILSLMTQNGYTRKLTNSSQLDDWYVKTD